MEQDSGARDASWPADADAVGSGVIPDDAGEPDASAATAYCTGDDPQTLGHDCAGVIICLNVGPCDVTRRTCCMELLGLENSCTTATTCGTLSRSVCDGPEDCQTGQACCLEGLSSFCLAEDACPEPNRVCHEDADCDVGRCVLGTYQNGLHIAREWGFCRG